LSIDHICHSIRALITHGLNVHSSDFSQRAIRGSITFVNKYLIPNIKVTCFSDKEISHSGSSKYISASETF
jgi:hypothetical protein